jgi:DnaK suppressor protein
MDGVNDQLQGFEAALADIEDALNRLNEGSYGVCEACGEPIGDGELEVRPTARRHAEHAAG